MPLGRQLVQIVGRNKFSIGFESLCSILREFADSNESKSGQIKLQRLFLGNRDSFVKGTKLSVLILKKSQAGRKFEVLEAACLVSIFNNYSTRARWISNDR